MNRIHRKIPLAIPLGMALLASLPAAAQKIIAVQVKVEDLRSRTITKYGLGDAVPVNVGDRLRVFLVGTAIVNGTGVESPVDARFGIGSGRDVLSISQAGPNSVAVDIRGGGGDNRAQLTYSASSKYDMAHNRDGRITFEIGGGGPGPGSGPGQDQGRRDKALRLASVLYRAILNQDVGGPQGEQDVNRIYQAGYRGVREVGIALARQAEQSGLGRSHSDRGYSEKDTLRVGDLYRQLLKRSDSYQTLWDSDPGFRDNVKNLHERGLASVVQTIIDSQEFVNAQNLGRFDAI
jgi:hypothetical protein